jgi:hypothetical protein
LIAPASPRYAPYGDGETGFRIALQPLDPSEWIEPDHQAVAQFANKARLLRERPDDVIAALPESLPAQHEVLTRLAAFLPERFPKLYRRTSDSIDVLAAGWTVALGDTSLPAIARAGLLVQEDLCVMEADASGAYRLTAASLAAPSVWRLADKIGKALPGIHEPVPLYGEVLGGRVDRIFTHLRAGAPLWRTNWSVMSDDTLFQPGTHDRTDARLAGLDSTTAGERLFLRVERQTLTRLPASNAILFTIKTHIDPLAAIAGREDLVAGLTKAVVDMPEGMSTYKALRPLREALLGWLSDRQPRV